MRNFENFLKVSGWDSEFRSIQQLLDHLARKTKSESSRRHYLESVYALCKKQGKAPDELVAFGKAKAERAVQSLLDDMKKQDRSIRYINVTLANLLTFFDVNGFKHNRKLDVERYHQPSRYMKRGQYIPTDEEVRRMADNAGSPKARACILGLYTSGARNATLRAILYKDVKTELDAGLLPVHVPIYPAMKKVDPDACKNSLPYTTFFSRDAAVAVKTYVDEFNRKNSTEPLKPDEPLFQGKVRGRPIKRRTLEVMVKDAARRAGIEQWENVYPHLLRKAFERAVRNSGLDTRDQDFLIGRVLEGSADTYMDKTKTEEFRGKHEKVKFFPEPVSEQARREALTTTMKLLTGLGVSTKITDLIRVEMEKAPPEKVGTLTDKVYKLLSESGRPVLPEELREFFHSHPELRLKTYDYGSTAGRRRTVPHPRKDQSVRPKEPTKQPTKRFCTECGRELKEGAKFCGNCGTTTG